MSVNERLQKKIRVELISDLCPASGNSFAGHIDTDICFDSQGLPYIPGKRLKGCLRECGLDILSVDDTDLGKFNKLFGETGSSVSEALNIDNGRLENYEDILSQIGDAHSTELADVYTSIRTRTRMKGGKAAPGTLRAARVLNQEQVYEFPVTLAPDTEGFLDLCVKSLRSMGLNRSRGLGEVTCRLLDGTAAKNTVFEIIDYGDQKALFYNIKLREPVVMAERSGKSLGCEDYIFGSTVLGIFAGRYVSKKNLRTENAHENSCFREIFLDGKVIFTAAMPSDSDNGKIYNPAPITLRTDKLVKRLADESLKIAANEDGQPPICKTLGGYISIENGFVDRNLPEKVTFIHHARPEDKGKGRADEKDGAMYTYEALAEGQTFSGMIIGEEKHLKQLAVLFQDDNTLRIGRSRTAQYGKGIIRNSAPVKPTTDLILKNKDKFRLVAVTPILLENDNGVNTTALSVITSLLGDEFKIIRYACSETTVAGYNGKWLMPRQQERALKEGSVIVFEYTGKGTTLKSGFIGKRTGEGFGQIIYESAPQTVAFPPSSQAGASRPNLASSTLPKVDELRRTRKAISEGVNYGETKPSPPNNTNLQRMIISLKSADNFCDFVEKLLDIKQSKQKTAALSFATSERESHFKTSNERLDKGHIVCLLHKYGIKGDVFRVIKKDRCIECVKKPDQLLSCMTDEINDQENKSQDNSNNQPTCNAEYKIYRELLKAAAQRVMQNRRSSSKNRQKGGDSVGNS